MNANLESLQKTHGKEGGERAFREIADLGGFGNVESNYGGGLDLAGVLSDGNTAVSESAKARIAELTGVDRGKATGLVEEGKGSTPTPNRTKEK